MRLTWRSSLTVAGLALLSVGTFLGGSGRLTYHEAFVAEAAREILASGDWIIPTVGGTPWLEKPPLPFWLAAGAGRLFGGIDETLARLPFAISAVLLSLGVATFAARRFGDGIGLFSGLVQATTLWTVVRGRLAEADILLASIVVWSIAAFDRAREESKNTHSRGFQIWRCVFFALLGVSALAKGIGFGGVLILAVISAALVWDRDAQSFRRVMLDPWGWLLTLLIGLAWPCAVLTRQPAAMDLWIHHVTDRLASKPTEFAGERWWQYAPSLFWQTLPWTIFGIVGAWRSWASARSREDGKTRSAERLLWAWAILPALLVSVSPARNAHYLIYSLPPWSVWSARVLVDWRRRRSASQSHNRLRFAPVVCAAGAIACTVGFGAIAPRFDKRGIEWTFYEHVGKILSRDDSLVLIYDDWDRKPYRSPFGPIPHDLGVRLFYLDRAKVEWRAGVAALAKRPLEGKPISIYVIARDRDLSALKQLGKVEVSARGPRTRWDRAFLLYRLTYASCGSS